MKGGYHSIEAVYELFSNAGFSTQQALALFVMLLMAGAMLVLVRLSVRYQTFRRNGGLSGIRTRKKIKSLREQGQLDGDFTFRNAVELSETSTVRKESLEDKMVNCVVPVEILFRSVDHGLYYQFELGEVTKAELTGWLEVARSLNLTEISEILEEALLMHRVICRAEYDPEVKQGNQTLGDRLWKRASELHAKMAEINGIAQLRAATETHLRRNAPEMLPLPTW